MKKLNLTINLSNINKDKIIERTFKNKNGESITVKEYKIDCIPLKEEKILTSGDGWELYKTHFLVEPQSKEEREKKVESVFLGEGVEFRDSTEVTAF